MPCRAPVRAFSSYRSQLPARHLGLDRKSTRLNFSHGYISYAVFCLKKKNLENIEVFYRAATQFKLTHTRWQRFARLLKQYEGWSSALRAEYGHETITILVQSSLPST